MLKILLTTLVFSFSSFSFGGEVVSEILDANGEFYGEVFTDDASWRNCTAEDELAGDCEPTNPVVCMTYGNTCYDPIVCRLEVSARLIEPYTGFTKKVTDVRTEIVFYNSTHEVCFNFSKDRYHLWHLVSTSDPLIECAPFEKPKPSTVL